MKTWNQKADGGAAVTDDEEAASGGSADEEDDEVPDVICDKFTFAPLVLAAYLSYLISQRLASTLRG